MSKRKKRRNPGGIIPPGPPGWENFMEGFMQKDGFTGAKVAALML
jgi:hypothetical protein